MMTQTNFSPTKTISELLKTLEHPPPKEKLNKIRPPLDIELIRKNMKMKWKDPGYCNFEFQKPNILRAKLLTQWEYQRIPLAERSYKNPKGFKGIKFDNQSREFGENRGITSQKFSQYLSKVKESYENNIFGSSNNTNGQGQAKRISSIDDKKLRIRKMLTENSDRCKNNFGMFNSTLNKGYFGMGAFRSNKQRLSEHGTKNDKIRTLKVLKLKTDLH